MQVFRDVTVMPTQALRNGMGKAGPGLKRGIYRGGPLWPLFSLRRSARHCRGRLALPCDVRPVVTQRPERSVEDGVWCGPVSPHFGHMIADFGMRIAEAAHRTAEIPLVFSVGPAATHPEPRPFFHAILRHLGVPEERVMLIREPTRFRRLRVPAQSELVGGSGPSAAHLDLMDAATAPPAPVRQDIDLLFVSRSRFSDGRLVAEAYLDAVLAEAGAVVIRPEGLDLPTQFDFYRRAKRIVFSEGSALHGLQLLGRLDTEVIVLMRRPRIRLAQAALQPRLRRLDYWDLTRDLLYGLGRNGRPRWDRAVAILDVPRLFERFAAIGLDLAPRWDDQLYRKHRDADVRGWIRHMRSRNLHPATPAAIQRCLRGAGIDIAVDPIWTMPVRERAARARP